MILRKAGWRAWLAGCALALAACSGGNETTPASIAEATTIDFANVANYAAPKLPPYFDRAAGPSRIDDRVATLGRVLFYDLQLSTNNRASCASCHQQAVGFTDPMRFSNGISSAATTDFHSMRLGDFRYWEPGSAFWDRRVASAEAQAGHPIRSAVELGWGTPSHDFSGLIRKLGATAYYPDLFKWAYGDPAISEERIQNALGQFVRSIVSTSNKWDEGYAQVFSRTAANPALDTDLPNFTAQENRGLHLFMRDVDEGGAGCSSCHVPPTFALAADARSNGLDPGEERLFKAPSLRNVGLTGPYMHDGRFDTLEQVVEFYDHEIQEGPALDPRLRHGGKPQRLKLGAPDRNALVAFLRTLSDRKLVTEARFSDPFRRNRPG